jgi:hypothetical protein
MKRRGGSCERVTATTTTTITTTTRKRRRSTFGVVTRGVGGVENSRRGAMLFARGGRGGVVEERFRGVGVGVGGGVGGGGGG